ncbi:hypothetical protein LB559_13385 [Mesorhizobium sp. BR1-1-3]|uniref:hypothetical protein n=1 Tax=Mesorhizobium sp. BR1-1-3 TaxID=2876651 RepID=UPI001CD146B1|nr:hypothetical protein [Mesorhizobium sp. BR1-1-3]MBZ9888936.1 hypothetical protein [Mesorhizobium sp. BR1-1-3]
MQERLLPATCSANGLSFLMMKSRVGPEGFSSENPAPSVAAVRLHPPAAKLNAKMLLVKSTDFNIVVVPFLDEGERGFSRLCLDERAGFRARCRVMDDCDIENGHETADAGSCDRPDAYFDPVEQAEHHSATSALIWRTAETI